MAEPGPGRHLAEVEMCAASLTWGTSVSGECTGLKNTSVNPFKSPTPPCLKW